MYPHYADSTKVWGYYGGEKRYIWAVELRGGHFVAYTSGDPGSLCDVGPLLRGRENIKMFGTRQEAIDYLTGITQEEMEYTHLFAPAF